MTYDPTLDLILTRDLAAPRGLIYACWTNPTHLPHWFVPKPNRVTHCTLDLRAGGQFNTTFDIGGQIIENAGVFLEVVPNEKLVFTDAYSAGWKPSLDPFMTAILTFEDIGNGHTRYTAVARHRTPEAAAQHKDMGFFEGWGVVATQLEHYAQSLM
jgi:uncharacterized protein YndB with AHSA1/START domain